MQKWCDSRGNLDTMKRIKAIRLHVTRYLCGQPLFKPAHPSIGLNASGLPRSLGPLKGLIHSENPNNKRLLLTLLRVSTVIPCEGQVDIASIVNPSTGQVSPELKEEFNKVLSELK